MSQWTPLGSTSNWHPPCNARYGRMDDPAPIICERPPGHTGHHACRAHGIRWTWPGKTLPRCSWRSCTAPDSTISDDDSVRHFCPSGNAAAKGGGS